MSKTIVTSLYNAEDPPPSPKPVGLAAEPAQARISEDPPPTPKPVGFAADDAPHLDAGVHLIGVAPVF
jgi:hypothetical protein